MFFFSLYNICRLGTFLKIIQTIYLQIKIFLFSKLLAGRGGGGVGREYKCGAIAIAEANQ